MEDKAYKQYKMNQGLFYVVFTGLFFLLIRIIQVSNEIHRFNARGKNWRKSILYLLMLYLIYIVINLILFLNRQPKLMRTTFGILILSQLLWIGNDEFLEGKT